MGTDDLNELAMLRVRCRRLEQELQERDVILRRTAEALRRPPVYDSEAYRLLDLMHHLIRDPSSTPA